MRRKLVARVSDNTGAVVANTTLYLLRSGARITSGAVGSIGPSASGTIRVEHPGSLKDGDKLFMWDGATAAGTLSVSGDPTFNTSWWDVTIQNSGTDTIPFTAGNWIVSKWGESAQAVAYYSSDTTATATGPGALGQLVPDSDGQIETWVDAVDVDIAIVQNGVLSTYIVDAPVEGRDYITPEEFGAVGDGSTDDTQPLLATFNYAGLHGLRVQLEPKVYVWDGTLLPLVGGMQVTGYGATLKLAAGSYSANVYCMGTRTATAYAAGTAYEEGVLIEGLKIDGNIGSVTTTASSLGIVAHQVRDWTIRDVEIVDLPGTTGGGYGISFWYSDRVTVDSCHIDRTDRQNILVWETQEASITNCRLKDSYFRGNILVSTNSPATLQASYADISGCDLVNSLSGGSGANRGVRFSGESAGRISGGKITATDQGVYIVGTDAKGKIALDGVEIAGCSDGLGADSNSVKYITVTDCYFSANTRGIYMNSGDGTMIVKGCTFKGNTSNAARIEFIDYVVVDGNIFDGGANVQMNVSNYGIFANNLVTNMTNAAGAVALNGSGAYWANHNTLTGNTSDLLDVNSTATTGTMILSGTGTPVSAVPAPAGSIYLRDDAAADAAVYIKESGAANTTTGWRALVDPVIPTTVEQSLVFSSHIPESIASNHTAEIHGGLREVLASQVVSTTPVNLPMGISKLLIHVSAVSGASTLTISGTTIDRNTGAETTGDSEAIVLSGLSAENSNTDAVGETIITHTDAYITSKWFVDDSGTTPTIAADAGNATVTVYSIAFEQCNDDGSGTLDTVDITGVPTDVTNCELSAHLISVEVTGQRVTTTDVANTNPMVLAAADIGTANEYFRIRRSNIAKALDFSTDGFFLTLRLESNTAGDWEDVHTNVWVTTNKTLT